MREKTVSSKSKKKSKKSMKGGQSSDQSGDQGSGNTVPEGAPSDADNLAAFIDARKGIGFKPYVSGDMITNNNDSGSAVSGQDENQKGGGKKSRKDKHTTKKGKRGTKKGKKNGKINMRGGQDGGDQANTVPNPDAIAGVIGQVQAALKGTDLAGSTETTPGVLPGKVADVAANAAADALDAAGGKVNAADDSNAAGDSNNDAWS